MKRTKHLFLFILSTALLLSLAACGQKENGITNEMLASAMEEGAKPDGPARPESEVQDNIEAAGIVVDYRTETLATTAATEPQPLYPLQEPPNITLKYQFKLGDSGLVQVSYIQPAGFTWTVENKYGVGRTTHVDALRPCDNEKTQRFKLDKLSDNNYVLEVGWKEERIESYTLKSYPIDKYEESHAVECTIQDSKLTVHKGAYYYELIVHYHQGAVVYGFFVE